MKRRPEMDGLRAIAVVPVLFFHAGIGCRGGYVGVDVFFVISGYLITGLILNDLNDGHFRILEFWERRVRRILPAVAVVVLTSLAAGWFLFLPQDFKQLGNSVIAQELLLSNVYFLLTSGYFEQPAEVKPLIHTWSLAVEEQFYLLFPFLLIALKRFKCKSLPTTIILLCFVSFSLNVYGSYKYPSATFYLLPTRGWELLIGAFLAALPPQPAFARWLKEALSWCGLFAIFYGVFFYDRDTRFPGVAALLPCVGTALVIWTNDHTLTSTGRLLATRPLIFIGLISYSLYLWHWPMLVFSKYRTLDQIPLRHRILLLLTSTLLAALSWRFVETPLRKRMVLKNRVQIFAFASAITAVLLVAGLAVHQTQGVPSRIPPEVQRYADGRSDHAFQHDLSLKEALNGDFVELGTDDKHHPVDLLVWGDSHAMAVMPVLDRLCKEHLVRGVGATHSRTAPLLGYVSLGRYSMGDDSIAYNNAILEFIRTKRVGNVILVAKWNMYVSDNDAHDGTRLRRSLRATISALKDSGAKIWIMKQVPEQPWDVPKALASMVFFGGDPKRIGLPLAEHRKRSQHENLIFEGLGGPGVAVLDPTDFFVSDTDLCRVAKDGHALYYDREHLTVHGAMMLRPLFEPTFGRMGKN